MKFSQEVNMSFLLDLFFTCLFAYCLFICFGKGPVKKMEEEEEGLLIFMSRPSVI